MKINQLLISYEQDNFTTINQFKSRLLEKQSESKKLRMFGHILNTPKLSGNY